MPLTTANLSGVVINEVGTVPSGSAQDLNSDGIGNSDDEFVELYNGSGSSVDISGWEIWENGSIAHTISGSTILAAGEYFVAVDQTGLIAGPIGNVNGATAEYTDNGLFLTADDIIMLYDPGTNTYVVYGGADATGTDLGVAIGNLLTLHPGATQMGSSEQGVATSAGNTSQRSADGEASWVDSTFSPGAPNCFLAGTLIATPQGEKPVETLRPGDQVVSPDGAHMTVRFNFSQVVSTAFGPAERLMPVRIAAGAIAQGVPSRDLVVTTDHAILIDGILCHAGALLNGDSIARVMPAEFGGDYTVYHVETEAHGVLVANGAPAESFIDNVSRRSFDNWPECEALYGARAERDIEELPYPRAMSARQLPAGILAKLLARTAA